MALLRLLSGALVVLLALPLVAAAPAEGRIEVEGALLLRGDASFSAPSADLLWNGTAAPTLTIQAESLHVERRGTTHTVQKTPLGPGVRLSEGGIEERADHAAATVTLQTGEGAQVAVLRATGLAQVAGADLRVQPVEGVQLFQGPASRAAGCREMTLACAEATGVYAVGAPASRGTLQGDLVLYLMGPTALVTTSSGDTTYRSGVSQRTSGTMTVTEESWLVVVLKGATAVVDAPAAADWFAAQPRFDAAAIDLEQATGALSVGSRTYRAEDEAVAATGALVVQPDALAAKRDALADQSRLVYAPSFAASVSGDVATINLRAAPVYTDDAAQTVGLVAGLAAVAGALAWYWPHVSFHAMSAALPFYTRLKRPELLENDVRNAIYGIIRVNPGISARAVQRESELSWGTVVYHLRQLERHHLVVSRAVGRTRNYYENHGKYKGMEVQLACLQSPRALALARIILRQPGMTQEALAEASGYPQPTTSYYVRKLKQADLVDEQREGRYARYLPKAELSRFVDLADAPTAEPAPAAPA